MAYSLETNKNAWQPDYPRINQAPSTNILIGMWTKPIVPNNYPLQSGNHEIICFGGNYWELQQITDNTLGNSKVDETIQNFNQNGQFFGSKTSGGALNWASDYTYYLNSGTIARSVYLDWKYSMWQCILDIPGNQITMRQWIKWGLTGAVQKTGDQVVTFAQLRTALETNAAWTPVESAAWAPDNMNHIYLGDSSGDGTTWNNITAAKVFNRSTEPSLAEVDAYALNFNADTTAWADWDLKWVSGAPNLADRSGNGRTLTNMGTIYQGTFFSGGDSGGGSSPLNYRQWPRHVPPHIKLLLQRRKRT